MARITRPFQRESSKRTERRPRWKLENEKISRGPSAIGDGGRGGRRKKLHHQAVAVELPRVEHTENVKFFGKAVMKVCSLSVPFVRPKINILLDPPYILTLLRRTDNSRFPLFA